MDITEQLKMMNDESGLNMTAVSEIMQLRSEIERLRSALRRIGYDYVELSYEKVQWLYLEHIKIAKEAYQESFKESGDF